MDNQHERAGWWYDSFCEGVDLNAFLVRECRAMSRVAALRGDPDSAAFFAAEAERVARAVQTLWDEQDGIFYDRDERTGARSASNTSARSPRSGRASPPRRRPGAWCASTF